MDYLNRMLQLDFDVASAQRRLAKWRQGPDPATERLFQQVASLATEYNRRRGWQPMLFAFMDAHGIHGNTWEMIGVREPLAMTHLAINKLIGSRARGRFSRDAGGVLPGAAARASGCAKLLLDSGCNGCLRIGNLPMISSSADARFVQWLNDQELFCLGEPGAVPIFDAGGTFVCAIAASGGGSHWDEVAVEAGLRMAGLEPRENGWMWRGEYPRRSSAAGLALGAAVEGGVELSSRMSELRAAVRSLESAIADMKPGAAAEQMQSALEMVRATLRDDVLHTSANIAPMFEVPEALISCRPPALKARRPVEGAARISLSLQRGEHRGRVESLSLSGEPAIPAPLEREVAARIRDDWAFDLHAIPARELPALCYGVFFEHDEFGKLGVDRTKLWRFTREIASRYRSNSFHSFRHATDATLTVSCLLRMAQRVHPGLLSDPVVVVSLIVAAMIHDTDHPGVMNPFLVNTRHPLAVLYNNRSVLENHHCATALALLERPELNFVSHLPTETQETMRKHMTTCVLATDVMLNFGFVKELNGLLETGAKGGARGGTALPLEHAMKLIIKAADVSNPTRVMKVYKPWIAGVMAEFFAQGDAEKELGLPVSMNCDRHTVDVNQAQIGFIKFIVKPLFECAAKFIPELSTGALANVEGNLAFFSKAEPMAA